jgi:hypothetical protein
MSKWLIFCLLQIIVAIKVVAQPFASGVGEIGTTAISKDSSIFIMWASKALVQRGPMDINDNNLGFVTFGSITDAIGKADGKVISLGDKGEITLQFDYSINDGDGADFAVFENSFNNTFLELAFVEVSSDGSRFVRFPTTSLSQNSVQFGNDAFMDPTQLNNLAGKYRGSYGTPFDLSELKDSAGIDLESITHIKLIDVVGSIDTKFGSRDSKNNLINDPYPTPYPSGGFDLDAIGVIHSNVLSIGDLSSSFSVYPNPTTDLINLQINKSAEVNLYNVTGQIIVNKTIDSNGYLNLSEYPKGTYYLRIENNLVKIVRL